MTEIDPMNVSLTKEVVANPQLSYISKSLSLLPQRLPREWLTPRTIFQRHKTKRASIAPLSKLPNRIKDKPRSEKRSLEWSVRLKSYRVAASTFLQALLKL